jgi:riboflavin kinase / FMN adenylyltransferase
MERIVSANPVPAHLRGSIMALGNFDGFHGGHQAVVARARDWATAEGRPLIIATFDPHPVRLFRPDAPFFRLTSLNQRERLFGEAGADAMLVFAFDHALASLNAEAFMRLLVDHIGAAGVVTGDDFTFGAGRSGTVAVLAEKGPALGLVSEAVAAVLDSDGQAISSSRIRDVLQAGDCQAATRLLTRPFAIEGEVIHGAKLGRSIGFPTANVTLGHYLRPAYGIYAVRARLADGRKVNGAANLGIRPTFDPPVELLETTLFDFAEDLYGQRIEVELIEYLRAEAKFDGIEPLVAQMELDCARARQILAGDAQSA